MSGARYVLTRRLLRAPVALAALLCALASGTRAAAETPIDVHTPGPLPRIVGGTITGEYHATGALLSGNNPATASLNCSGVLIGCETFLTAAHCVCETTGSLCQPPNDPDPTQMLVYFQNAGFVAVDEVFVHPDFDFPTADLAIVKLTVPVDGIPPVPINFSTPVIPSGGEIVGFGRTGGGGSNDDFGVKRVGDVISTDCTTGSNTELICWDYTGADSNTCSGDSGGPLFMDLGAGDVVAGITSGGVNPTCLQNDHSFDVNVANYTTWIQSVAGGDLGGTSCGTGSQLGDPDVLAFSESGILVGDGATQTFSFTIASGSDQLRIALNGHDNGESNFDMFVRQGTPPTPTVFDCRQNATGQFGYCQFNNPAGGLWFIRIDQVEGSGKFQVTVTNTGTQPPDCGNDVQEPGEDCDGLDSSACDGLCQLDCMCPAPICGNAVAEAGEECDGAAAAGCVAGCEGDCECACLSDRLDVRSFALDDRRLKLKTRIDNSGGEFTGLDPRLAFRATFDDGDGGAIVIAQVPGGDPGWLRSKPSKGRFKWKGDIGGVRRVNIRDKSSRDGTYRVDVKGKHPIGGLDYDDRRPASVEIEVETVCVATLCGDLLINESVGEECDEGAETLTCDDDCTAPACGDGNHNATVGELCDDGGESVACDLDCTPSECGDGTLNQTAGEQCDDANLDQDDPCPTSCIGAFCGDGFLCTAGGCTTGPSGGIEACDDGASNSDAVPDACRTDCALPSCGDGVSDFGEICDDAGESAACDDDCTEPLCGDGNHNVAAGEACDTAGVSSICDPDCTVPTCGDGYINNPAGEECDDQDANNNDSCPTTCLDAECGDGFLCTFPDCTSGPSGGAEQCDDGEGNSDSAPDACRTDCTAPFCGDLILDSAEVCDEGGETGTCDDDCTPVSCGDGNHNATAGELCDDGDPFQNDPCLNDCTPAACGDGFVCTNFECTTGPGGGVEECDDGGSNSDSTPDACRTDCAAAGCGDGVIDTGEDCADAGESATCDTDCTTAVCGDGVTNTTAGEQCDDGGTVPGDGCDEFCQNE